MADNSASILPQLQALVTYRNINVDETVSDSDSSSIAENIIQRPAESPMASGAATPRIPGLSIYDQENWSQQERDDSPGKSPLPKRRRGNSQVAETLHTNSRPKANFLDTISPSGLEANTLNDSAQRAGLRLSRPAYRPIANDEKCICVIRLFDNKSGQLLFETGSQPSHAIAAHDHSQAKVNAVRLAMRFVEEYKSGRRPSGNTRSPAVKPAPPVSPASRQIVSSRPPVASSAEQQSGAADSRPTGIPSESGGRENWIGILYEYCQHGHREPPNFVERANADMTEFSCTCDLTLPSHIQLVPGLYSAITVQSKAKRTQIVTFGSHSDVHNSKMGAKRTAARTAVIALMAAGEKVVPPGEARLRNLFGIYNGPKHDAPRAGLPIRSPASDSGRTNAVPEPIRTSQTISPAHPHAQTATATAGVAIPQPFTSAPKEEPVPKPRHRFLVTEPQITAIIDDDTTPLNKKVLRMSELLALPAPQFQWSKTWPQAKTDAAGADRGEPLISGGAVFRGLEKDKRISDAEVRWLTGLIGEVNDEKGLPAAREKSARLVLGLLKRIAMDRVEEDKRRTAEEKIEIEVQEQIRAEAGYRAETDGRAQKEAAEKSAEPQEEDLLISMDD